MPSLMLGNDMIISDTRSGSWIRSTVLSSGWYQAGAPDKITAS